METLSNLFDKFSRRLKTMLLEKEGLSTFQWTPLYCNCAAGSVSELGGYEHLPANQNDLAAGHEVKTKKVLKSKKEFSQSWV